MNIPGIKIEKDNAGRTSKVIFDAKKHRRLLEDILDALEAKERLKNPVLIPWEDVKAKLDKKHNTKNK